STVNPCEARKLTNQLPILPAPPMTSARRPLPVPRAITLACSCVVSEERMRRRSSSSASAGDTPRSAAASRPPRITSRSRPSSRSGGSKGLRPGTDTQNALTLPLMHEHRELLPDPLPPEPLEVVARWLDEAWAARVQPNANSMVLATSRRDGRPSARVVLCKEIAPKPGYVVFYTNYLSSKGRQLQDNPRAAAVMHWAALPRQGRVGGERVPAAASGI